MAPNDDMDRLRHGLSTVRVADQIEAVPLTPTTPTNRMHLLSGLRTAPKGQTSKTRGYAHPNVGGFQNGYNAVQSGYNGLQTGHAQSNPSIILNSNPPYDQIPRSRHKHSHSRGSSASSLQVPIMPPPVTRPDTPESSPEQFDPQLYASLQQQYLELLTANQYLVQQHQQMRLQQQYLAQVHPLAFLSPPRTPVSTCYPQYTETYLSPPHQFVSPRRSRFDTTESDPSRPPSAPAPPSVGVPVGGDGVRRTPSPGTSPSPASSESSWRRGHRRGKSSISINGSAKALQPVRQPYGPPPMDDLLRGKGNGQSLNFAARVRRKAVTKLLQAGMERKAGGMTPGMPGTNPLSGEAQEEFDPRRRSALF